MDSTFRRWRYAFVLVAFGILVVGSWQIAGLQAERRPMNAARAALLNLPVEVKHDYRTTPVALSAGSDLPQIVQDDVLKVVLESAAPRWFPPPVPNLIHEMKLWGPKGDFRTYPDFRNQVSGQEALEVLLSDEKCKLRTAPVGGDYILKSPYGLRVIEIGLPEARESRGEGHIGQLLMVLGEAGIPLETPVTANDGQGTVADLLSDLQMRFNLSGEVEFASVAFALWMPHVPSWENRHGQRISFDGLVETLVKQPMGTGACHGCHVFYALAVLLQVNAEHGMLSSQAVELAEQRLVELRNRLELVQASDGAWESNWSGNDEPVYRGSDELLDKITVTGHHLEWIALVPERLRPSDDICARAVQSLKSSVTTLLGRKPASFKNGLPCTHAARALCLLRHVDAFTEWKRLCVASN